MFPAEEEASSVVSLTLPGMAELFDGFPLACSDLESPLAGAEFSPVRGEVTTLSCRSSRFMRPPTNLHLGCGSEDDEDEAVVATEDVSSSASFFGPCNKTPISSMLRSEKALELTGSSVGFCGSRGVSSWLLSSVSSSVMESSDDDRKDVSVFKRLFAAVSS